MSVLKVVVGFFVKLTFAILSSEVCIVFDTITVFSQYSGHNLLTFSSSHDNRMVCLKYDLFNYWWCLLDFSCKIIQKIYLFFINSDSFVRQIPLHYIYYL